MASGDETGEGGAPKGLGGVLLDAATRVVARAVGKVLSDPRGQEIVARAVGLAQRGKKQAEEVQEKLMAAAGIPGRQDYQDLAKQVARIKRKARDLAGRLEPERRKADSGGEDDGDGEGGEGGAGGGA